MKKDEKQLWDKIAQFKFDDENVFFSFSNRLARENNWSVKFAESVIEEYKKFIFLCCLSPTSVTPSDQIDQAWHLHLTYTKSYWKDFCQNTLQREIHHNPTKGGTAEGKKFDDFYTQTKEAYRKIFNLEPPLSIWPDNHHRFSDINFKRINMDKNWVITKPQFRLMNSIKTLLALIISAFLIQASFTEDKLYIPILFIALFVIVLLIKNKDGNDKNGQGCSGTGCSGGYSDSGHSGCSSHGGCSSGCSGCGGCGGGCGS